MCHGCGVDQCNDPMRGPLCNDPQCTCTFTWMHGSARGFWAVDVPICTHCQKKSIARQREYMEKLPDSQAELRECIRLHLATLKDEV